MSPWLSPEGTVVPGDSRRLGDSRGDQYVRRTPFNSVSELPHGDSYHIRGDDGVNGDLEETDPVLTAAECPLVGLQDDLSQPESPKHVGASFIPPVQDLCTAVELDAGRRQKAEDAVLDGDDEGHPWIPGNISRLAQVAPRHDVERKRVPVVGCAIGDPSRMWRPTFVNGRQHREMVGAQLAVYTIEGHG